MGSGRDVTRQWKARPERLAVVPTIGVRGRGFCIPFAYSSAACLCAWAPGADRAETSKCFPGTCPIQHRQLPMGQPSTSLSGRRLRLPLRIRTGRGRDAQSLLRRRLQPPPHQNSLCALPSLYGVCLPRQTPRAFSISPPPPLSTIAGSLLCFFLILSSVYVCLQLLASLGQNASTHSTAAQMQTQGIVSFTVRISYSRSQCVPLADTRRPEILHCFSRWDTVTLPMLSTPRSDMDSLDTLTIAQRTLPNLQEKPSSHLRKSHRCSSQLRGMQPNKIRLQFSTTWLDFFPTCFSYHPGRGTHRGVQGVLKPPAIRPRSI